MISSSKPFLTLSSHHFLKAQIGTVTLQHCDSCFCVTSPLCTIALMKCTGWQATLQNATGADEISFERSSMLMKHPDWLGIGWLFLFYAASNPMASRFTQFSNGVQQPWSLDKTTTARLLARSRGGEKQRRRYFGAERPGGIAHIHCA